MNNTTQARSWQNYRNVNILMTTLIALHCCDSPQHLLPASQRSYPGGHNPFGGFPFHPQQLPTLLFRNTDEIRASTKFCYSYSTVLTRLY